MCVRNGSTPALNWPVNCCSQCQRP